MRRSRELMDLLRIENRRKSSYYIRKYSGLNKYTGKYIGNLLEYTLLGIRQKFLLLFGNLFIHGNTLDAVSGGLPLPLCWQIPKQIFLQLNVKEVAGYIENSIGNKKKMAAIIRESSVVKI